MEEAGFAGPPPPPPCDGTQLVWERAKLRRGGH